MSKKVDYFFVDYSNVLLNAIKKRNYDFKKIQIWIDKGADVNHQDADGYTALNLITDEAVLFPYPPEYNEHTELIKLFLKNGANPNIQNFRPSSKIKDTNPLITAARFGKIKILKLLLECPEIDVNMKDYVGMTALMWAATNGHSEILIELLKKDADMDIKNNQGMTALMMATPETANILKEHEIVNKTTFVNEITRKHGFNMDPDTMKYLYDDLKKPSGRGRKSGKRKMDKRKSGKSGRTTHRKK